MNVSNELRASDKVHCGIPTKASEVHAISAKLKSSGRFLEACVTF